MIWVKGEKSDEFTALRDTLENSLLDSSNISFTAEKRAFSPHITLARIKQWDFKRIDPEERPQVEEDINFNFSVDSIEIMESQLKRSGAVYSILESHQLGI
jgi:2'-5' RNA ligase